MSENGLATNDRSHDENAGRKETRHRWGPSRAGAERGEGGEQERGQGSGRQRRGQGSGRSRGRRRGRTRGQSTPLDYTLSLGIAALVVTGLITVAGGFVEDRRESVIRTELEVVGEQLAGELAAADRLAQSGNATEAMTITKPLPAKVAGEEYSIETETKGSTQWLHLTAPEPGVSVSIRYETTTDVAETAIQGGKVEIVYDPSASQLEVRS